MSVRAQMSLSSVVLLELKSEGDRDWVGRMCHTVRGPEVKRKSSRVRDYVRSKSLVLVL